MDDFQPWGYAEARRAVLNGDKRVGPSANIIKRILSSPKLPPVARRKVEEFVEERISGLYGHSAWSHDHFRASPQPTSKLKQKQLHARWTVN